MSLNGLDGATLKEAHEAAVAEAGGWFLLKYASRDEVEVLARGSNGAGEMRSSIEQYKETSPLFGFLRYRRRNVVIKYIPEGCSRLIRARSTVHFTAVCDRLGPCETTLELSDAKELNEVKLSNTFTLHTASASTSSSNSSLRTRRLVEITEEEEEEQRETKRQSVVGEQDVPREIDAAPVRPRSPITGPPVTLDASIATSPKDAGFADTTEPPSFAGAAGDETPPASPAKSAKSFDTDSGRRMSSQSSRQDYYSSSSYLASKVRVKLGPRPSADPAGLTRSAGYTNRPVASMPAGLKLLLKGGKKAKPQDDSTSVISQETSENIFLAPALPDSTDRPHTSGNGGRPPSSSGISVKSLPATSAPSKQAMTPEKLRLMKALQLREKKKRAAAPVPLVPSVEITPSLASEQEKLNTAANEVSPVELADLSGSAPAETIGHTDSSEATQVVQRPMAEGADLAADQQSTLKADSVIDVVVTTAPMDRSSEHTHTDSRPPTPVCTSEAGDSTKASSISGSTDETLHRARNKDTGIPEAGDVEIQAAEEQSANGSTSNAEIQVANAPRAQEVDAPKALLSQTDGHPNVSITEADEHQHADFSLNEAPVALIPTSKFAFQLPTGQAAMNPMESRGQDPPNVTNVNNVTSEPGRADEADPVKVDTSEKTEDGSSASPSKRNLPISKYSSTQATGPSLAPSLVPDIVSSFDDSAFNGPDDIADAADIMVDDGATGEARRSELPEPIVTSSFFPEKEAPQQNGDATDEQESATDDDAVSSMAMSPTTETPPQPLTPRAGPLRTVSTPVHTAADAPPAATPSRSVSSGSALHQRLNQQPPSATHLAPGRQPGKLGGSLASRIKAFEQLASSKAPAAAAAPAVTSAKDRPSSAFFSVQRNSSIRDGARSPSVLDRAGSIYRGRTPTPGDSEESSESVLGRQSRDRSGSVASRMSVFEGGNAPRGKPETVQVTARIVREPGQNYPKAPESSVDPAEYPSLDLKQSPLIVDHRKDVETPNPTTAAEAAPVPTPLAHAVGESRRSLHERRLSKDKSDSSKDGSARPGQRTSLTMARDFFRDSMSPKEGTNQSRPSSIHHQSNSLLSRLSISSRRKSISQDLSSLSPISVIEQSETGDEKKDGTRTSRLMRRLSTTFSPGRKQSIASTLASPILPEEGLVDPEKTPRAQTAHPSAKTAKVVACMGDVNVQFPENLLWKRRTMSLDSNGFLYLSPSQGAISSRERQLKRFHMSEFQLPYTPEMEFQELPNSVCLDFKSGSGLQIALQDRIGQQNVLLVLQNAHQNHDSFGQ